jgi:hypothetical protein
MTQKVARVSGGAIFGALEVLFVLAIAAGVLYAGFVMTREGTGDGGEVEGSGPPARDGALFTLNPSFDEKDEGGFAKGWRYEVAGTDSFALVEGARGGPFALQVARYSPANAVSYAIGAPIDVKGARGVKASVFAMNSEYAVSRFGTAVLALFWFEHSRDREPILVTPLAFKTRLESWTELAGSAAVPRGATVFSVAVGICGASGSVAFDDAMAEAHNEAEDWWQPASVKLANGMDWSVAEDGSITLAAEPAGPLLRGGRISVHSAEGAQDPIDVCGMLAGKPTVVSSDSNIKMGWDYYDPMAERRVRLNLELRAEGDKARLTAGVVATADGPLDNAAPAGPALLAFIERYCNERTHSFRKGIHYNFPGPDGRNSVDCWGSVL